jgi:hypothetical protein
MMQRRCGRLTYSLALKLNVAQHAYLYMRLYFTTGTGRMLLEPHLYVLSLLYLPMAKLQLYISKVFKCEWPLC